MMRAFLFWLTGFLPCRIINDGDRPYLERYYLMTLFGHRFYIHRFVGSDPDRGLHDHPWPWAFSIILAGWYYEHTRRDQPAIDAVFGRKVRWFNFLTGDSFHRVVLPVRYPNSNMPDPELLQCWTLFFHRSTYVKPWGFLREKGQLGTVYTPHRSINSGADLWWKTASRRNNLMREYQ